MEISEFLKNKMPRLEVSHPNFSVIKSRALTSFNKLIVLVFDFGVIERIERNAFGRLVKLKVCSCYILYISLLKRRFYLLYKFITLMVFS